MPHLSFVREVKQVFKDLLPGQSRNTQRGHKLRSGLRQNRGHLCTAFAILSDQIQRLIGRYSAANDQKDVLVRQHRPLLHMRADTRLI